MAVRAQQDVSQFAQLSGLDADWGNCLARAFSEVTQTDSLTVAVRKGTSSWGGSLYPNTGNVLFHRSSVLYWNGHEVATIKLKRCEGLSCGS